MCKGNAPSHCATHYLYRLFFPPSFHFFHILLSYIDIPQTHNPPSPGPVLHFYHHTNSQENQSWTKICLKLFCHTTEPKAMSCHGTWIQQPLILFTAAFWSFQSKEFPLQHLQHRMSWGRHFQSNLSLRALECSPLPGLSGGCSLCEETFPGLNTEPEDSV